jgi:hypothetical protein
VNPIKTHTFAGQEYRVIYERREGQWGHCDEPGDYDRAVCLDPELDGLRHLEVAIHEALHALMWHWLAEAFVTIAARDIARFLWRLGYRRG